ncbi:MAG TPA: hypothetical protein VI094_18565 [Propionibacteriaceae bacterium]
MAEHPAGWLDQVKERIRFIQGTSFAFSDEALSVMSRILRDPIFDGTPMPLVSPAREAGISAEFRAPDIELQIEVDESGATTVYGLHRNVLEWDGLWRNCRTALRRGQGGWRRVRSNCPT